MAVLLTTNSSNGKSRQRLQRKRKSAGDGNGGKIRRLDKDTNNKENRVTEVANSPRIKEEDSFLEELINIAFVSEEYGDKDKYVGMPGSATLGRPPYVPPKERIIAQVHDKPKEMNLQQLEEVLAKRIIEETGRGICATLVDDQCAECGICKAAVPLYENFVTANFVNHINEQHPRIHRCSGSWPGLNKSILAILKSTVPKPLSFSDFAIADSNINDDDNLQCIWCGIFMDTQALAVHFYEVHSSEIEVPR
uniref:C2H2-type domain-containing protein n=1 Tax=Strongyloides papillosus TaxID=174720 RepID=A0A0N5CB16_STREA